MRTGTTGNEDDDNDGDKNQNSGDKESGDDKKQNSEDSWLDDMTYSQNQTKAQKKKNEEELEEKVKATQAAHLKEEKKLAQEHTKKGEYAKKIYETDCKHAHIVLKHVSARFKFF